MSLISSTEEGWIISHLKYLNNIYANVKNGSTKCKLIFNEVLFEINSQYLRENQTIQCEQQDGISLQSKTRKRKRLKLLPDEDLKEINYIKQTFNKMISKTEGLFSTNILSDNNEAARLASQKFYQDTFCNEKENFYGCNDMDIVITSELKEKRYVFPQKCKFYCYDVRDIAKKLDLNNQYDFILLDPPWWNKSIRRKKTRYSEASYKMMYNEELAKIPIGKLLCSNGLVAIWCTNAPSHLHSIFNNIFPSWGVTYRAKWYWVKITQGGNTICNFNCAPGKQPYELLVLGSVLNGNEINIPDGRLLISVPSAVHSHKPPLTEVMKDYLPNEPKCLEIFARYLLPRWTSWGLEVLKFQHLSLYTILEETKDTQNK
ncbi:N(6)-adenine-specific methyltransferase METTL4 [Apis laboriosa]|uniref:N(6)-adenine-specific DNA methyltransferase METTL4 n=1 Tax=Apis dorsata TaxID=7462 RepID=UPI0003DF50CB|nr:N(6)-adenine-specific DNA methyltransferase METTL4 [Apis dorsata]XP_043787220.1 N(6)-adenine-specific methyltransferase METTL4 [Apis laboriosa]